MKLNIALAAAKHPEAEAFASVMLVMLLDLNGEKTDSFKADVKGWASEASAFAKKFGFGKEFTKAMNSFVVKGDLSEDHADELGYAMKDAMPKINQDNKISFEYYNLIKDIGANLRDAKPTSWKRIHKAVSMLESTKLHAAFTLDEDHAKPVVDKKGKEVTGDLSKLTTEIRKVMKQLTGRDTCFYQNNDERAELAADPKKKKLMEQIAPLNKKLKAIRDREITNFVRASGKKMVDLEEVKKHLDKKGIPHNLVKGFPGIQVTAEQTYFTAEGRELEKQPYGTVAMNPKYDPDSDNTYAAKGTDHRVTYRTVEFLKGKKKARFSDVKDFIEKEDTYRAKWVKDLDSKKFRTQALAAMFELLWATSSRIGGKGNSTKGEPTYGMSTIRVSHMAVKSGYIQFDYTGKKLTPQSAQYKINSTVAKKVQKIVQKLIDGKGEDDLVFSIEGKPIGDGAARTYFKSNVGTPMRVHSLRAVEGTKMAQEFIAKSPFKKSHQPKQTEVEKWFKEQVIDIANRLHHRSGDKPQPSTSIGSYIDPEVINEFFIDKLGLRSPKLLKKQDRR
jgi:DNA topoisomerase IB